MSGDAQWLPNGHMDVAPAPTANNAPNILRRQISRFLVIGLSSVAIDLLVYFALLGSLSPWLAKGISYVAGMLFGFVGNKLWTFESKQRSLAEPVVYVLLYATTLAVNVGLNTVCIQAGEFVELAPTANRLLAFLVATGATTILNFLGMKFLTFRNTQPTSAEEA